MEGEIQLQLLTSEEQGRHLTLQSLFRHPGWDILVKELSDSIASTPTEAFWGAKTYEDILVQRIRVQERTVLVRYPELAEKRVEQLILQRSQMIADQDEVS